MGLTRKQSRFIDEYLQCFNATEAARRAGYSKRTAYAIGWENLRKPEIDEVIRKRLSESAMGPEEVLKRLGEQARGDIGNFLDITPMGFVVDLDKAKELGLTHLIKKAKQHTTTSISKDGTETEINHIEIELYDAQAALVQLGRHHKLFTDNVDLTSGGEPLKGYTVLANPDTWDASNDESDSGK